MPQAPPPRPPPPPYYYYPYPPYPAPPAPPPAGQPSTAPRAPDARTAPGYHEHDGFYLSLALGFAYLSDSIDSNRFNEANMSGVGFADRVAIGGTPARGLVIGGAIEDQNAFGPGLSIDGVSRMDGPSSVGLTLIGPFATYYFNPSEGFYVQALLGFGLLTADDTSDIPIGLGGSVGLGHEWWTGADSSFGLLFRFTYAHLRYDPSALDEGHSVFALAMLATYTYQ